MHVYFIFIQKWVGSSERSKAFILSAAVGRLVGAYIENIMMMRDILSSVRESFLVPPLEEAGLGPSLLLPVHDEVIAQAPNVEAEQVAQEIAATMSDVLGAVPIQADSEIVGTNWGAKYAPKELQQ